MRLALWTAGSCIAMSLLGCATVPPAARFDAPSTPITYSGARGWEVFPASHAAVVAALHDSMVDLSLANIRGARAGSVSRLEATTAGKERVVATIRPHQELTQVTIRVGWFGDEPLTKALLERLEVRLGTRAPEAIPETVPSAPSRNPYLRGMQYRTPSCCATSPMLRTTTVSFPGELSCTLNQFALHREGRTISRRKKKGPKPPETEIRQVWPASARVDPSIHAESDHEPCGQSRVSRHSADRDRPSSSRLNRASASLPPGIKPLFFKRLPAYMNEADWRQCKVGEMDKHIFNSYGGIKQSEPFLTVPMTSAKIRRFRF